MKNTATNNMNVAALLNAFEAEFGQRVKINASKERDARSILMDAIGEQSKILNGIAVLNKKGEKVQDWFRNGKMIPKIGNFNMFKNEGYPSQEGREEEMLTKFKKLVDVGAFDEQIAEIENDRAKAAESIKKARNSKKGGVK